MVLRIQVRAALTILAILAILASSCTFDVRRCEELREAARGAVSLAGRGCLSNDECRPIAMTCGEWGAIRFDAPRREVTNLFERAEAMCGCGAADAGPPALTASPAVSCVQGGCQVGVLDLPPVCVSLREQIVNEIAIGNRCAADTDCTSLNVLTCPPLCGQPIAIAGQSARLTSLLASYVDTAGCTACDRTCDGPHRNARCIGGTCVDRTPDGGAPVDGGAPGSCEVLGAAVDTIVATPSRCSGISDCTYVFFGGERNRVCGVSVRRDVAANARTTFDAWQQICCQSCAPTCQPESPDTVRCVADRCQNAAACASTFASAAQGWTVTWRRLGASARTMVVRSDGIAAVTPPGVQGMATSAEIAKVVLLADEAALLCTDSSFHTSGDVDLEITATVTGVGLASVRYNVAESLPSGLAALESTLRSIAQRVGQ